MTYRGEIGSFYGEYNGVGYAVFANDVFFESPDRNGLYRAMDSSTCQPFTEAVYENAKWFEEDLCPVKKNGKWGFIDRTGKEVTDFIFDDVNTVYNGKTYVKYNGKVGILDLKSSLDQGVWISADNVNF